MQIPSSNDPESKMRSKSCSEKTISVLVLSLMASVLVGQSTAVDGGGEASVSAANEIAEETFPKAVTEDHFSALMESSPFTRSLSLSDSILLTGVAEIDGKLVVTLFNKETRESYVVSETPNSQGWKMVEVSQDNDLEKIVAKIFMKGGEVVTVRFDENQQKPGEGRPAANSVPSTPRGEDNRTPPTDEDRRKFGEYVQKRMSKFTDEQKARVRQIMQEKHKENPKMNGRQKTDVFVKILDYVEANKR